jgi:hypothetical protein
MKKEYKAPMLVVVKVKTDNLLQTISRGDDWTSGESASRRGGDSSFWDDEEE